MKQRVWGWILFVCVGLACNAQAQAWRSVADADGCSWARVLFVNNSAVDSNWSLSGCRTAVASDAVAAVVEAGRDWDGVVEAGGSEYVWVYGHDIAEISIANADGEASAYLGSEALVSDGDGELTIVVDAGGVSSVSVEAGAAYEAPVVSEGGAP